MDIQYICEGENGQPKISNDYNDKIIVSMTSWTKRIKNVKTVLESILFNSELPAKIVINLAIEEFPNKEKDLPNDLVTLINKNNIIEIYWLKHNTKVWKKSIPTLIRYPNACVLCIDDDWIYPNDLIKTFYKKHNQIPNIPLAGCLCKCHERLNQHCGTASLDKLEWCMPWVNMLNDEIIDGGSEDDFMTYCYKMNNLEMQFVGKTFWINMKPYNSIESYSKSYFNNKHNNTWSECKKYIK